MLTIEEINELPSIKGKWFPANMNNVIVRIAREAAEAGAKKERAQWENALSTFQEKKDGTQT